jgi:hypothetical protein
VIPPDAPRTTSAGREPNLNDKAAKACGSWRAYLPDGTPLKPGESTMTGELATGDLVVDRELRIERLDGPVIDILVNIAPLWDAAGKITGAVNVFQDIIERQRAEPGCIESDIPDRKRAEEVVTAGGSDVPPTVRSREARRD